MKMVIQRISDEIVFLLTSTSPTYLRDALDLMFYPSQVDYRFRYDKKWLPEDFKLDDESIMKEKAQELVGKEAILVHILTEKHNEGYRILEFLPIRKAIIHDVKILGQFLWLGFTLGDWISYHQGSSNKEANEHHELFKQWTPKNSQDYVNDLVFFVKDFKIETIPDDSSEEDEEVLSNWAHIASHMSRFCHSASTETPVFMKLISVKDIDSHKGLNAKSLDSTQRGFELRAGKSYSLDIAQYCGENIEPFEIELKSPLESVMPTLGKAEVRGKYDMLRFMINCKSIEREQISTLSLEPSGENDWLIARALLTIKIKTGKWRNLWLPLLLFALSTFATSEQFGKFLAGQEYNIWILFLGALGTIFSTISLLFLRR